MRALIVSALAVAGFVTIAAASFPPDGPLGSAYPRGGFVSSRATSNAAPIDAGPPDSGVPPGFEPAPDEYYPLETIADGYSPDEAPGGSDDMPVIGALSLTASGRFGNGVQWDGNGRLRVVTVPFQCGTNYADWTLAGWTYISSVWDVRAIAGKTQHPYWYAQLHIDRYGLTEPNMRVLWSAAVVDHIATITTGQWVHWAIAYDANGSGGGDYLIYINGTLRLSRYGDLHDTEGTAGLYVGAVTATSTGSGMGQIGDVADEIACWHSVLNGTQISALYARTAPLL